MKDLVIGCIALALLCLMCIVGYQFIQKKQSDTETEYETILNTLNEETLAFFSRDYDLWADKWVHEPYATKSYMIFTDSTISETLGWAAIRSFGRDYLQMHPKPEPVPDLLDEIEIRLYGKGAWVSFEQYDSLRGIKRETRLMEKHGDQWKIAGMHTTIYGFQDGK